MSVKSHTYKNEQRLKGKESKISARLRDYLDEDHASKLKIEKLPKYKDVNVLVNKIMLGELQLPNPVNICCSQVFYLDIPISHSGLSESPFLILDEKESEQRKLIERSICALLNERRGGVILLGCELYDDNSLKLKEVSK